MADTVRSGVLNVKGRSVRKRERSGKLATIVRSRWIAGAMACVAPQAALACPVCFAAEQRQLWAYFGTAVLLSLLPFVVFAGIVLWLRFEGKRAQAAAVDSCSNEASRRPEAVSVVRSGTAATAAR